MNKNIPAQSDDQPATSLTDPVLALIKDYFLPTRLMHDHVHYIRDAAFRQAKRNNKLGRSSPLLNELHIYVSYWLSTLYVVCEAFCELKLKNDKIEHLIAEHQSSLRLYRNATFHFQKSPAKHVQFHDGSGARLNWAEDLHTELENLFCSYVGTEPPDHSFSIPDTLMYAMDRAYRRGRRLATARSEPTNG